MVFIVGMPRSGTTLLNYILHTHSKISIAPETHFFDKFFSKYENFNSYSHSKKIELLNSYLNNEDIEILDFTKEEKKQIIDNAVLSDFELKKTFYEILKKYSEKNNSKILGEKTPAHLEYIEILNKWFPNAKFIIIYRDPRDVCLSLKNVPWNNGNSETNARRWNRYIELSNKYKQNNQISSKLLEIQYEELILTPISIIKKICSHIEVSYEEQMLKYYENTTIKSKELKLVTWKDKNKESIDKNNFNKWINKLSLDEIKIIETITSSNLEKKGYLQYKQLQKDNNDE